MCKILTSMVVLNGNHNAKCCRKTWKAKTEVDPAMTGNRDTRMAGGAVGGP